MTDPKAADAASRSDNPEAWVSGGHEKFETPIVPVAAMNLNDYAAEAHAANAKWWERPDGTRIERNKGELLMLMVSEIAEAMEGERKDLPDDKLPYRRMAEVELADTLIRIFDYAAAFGYDLEGAYREKMEFNAQREDHTHEARALAGGKNGDRFHCDCRADDWVEGDNGAIRCERCGGYAGEPGTSIRLVSLDA